MKRTPLLLAIAALATVAPLPAQIQFGSLDQLASKAKENVDITLDGPLLQMAGKFLSGGNKSDDNPDAQKIKNILANLKAISVKSFKFAGEGEYRQDDLDPVRAQLKAPGWSKVIGNRNEKESSEIFTKFDGSHITGFAILAAEPKELTVVYIEGTLLDLADIAKLGGRFGIPNGVIPDAGKKSKDKTKGDQ